MKRTNKKIINKRLLRISLGVLLGAGCLLAQQSVQADQDRIPISAEGQARIDQAGQIAHDAAVNLHAGNYAKAEEEARQAESLDLFVVAPEVLAGALERQGKDEAALEAYRELAMDGQPRNLLPYAQLLLKSGQWAQAVAVYNQVLPHLPDVGPHPEAVIVHDGDVIRANSHFSPDVPQPTALATALHIARGMLYNSYSDWAGESQDTEAMSEYGKALQSAPDNALANYYYGIGWHKLSPADRAKFGTAQQAKAALQQAVKVGNADVKKAAQKALKDLG